MYILLSSLGYNQLAGIKEVAWLKILCGCAVTNYMPAGIIIRDAMKAKWPPHSMYYTLHICFSVIMYTSWFIKAYMTFSNADKGS